MSKQILIGLLFLTLTALGCAGTNSDSATEGAAMVHEITLAAPSSSESSSVRQSVKGQPYQVGFGRQLPADQRLIRLHKLSWHKVSSGNFATTIAIRSSGANSIRVGLKLNSRVDGLGFEFRDSNTPAVNEVTATQIAAAGQDPYWSPVIKGDTVFIKLKATTLPAESVILEIPTLSHIP